MWFCGPWMGEQEGLSWRDEQREINGGANLDQLREQSERLLQEATSMARF